jgi:hypothetical protein
MLTASARGVKLIIWRFICMIIMAAPYIFTPLTNENGRKLSLPHDPDANLRQIKYRILVFLDKESASML